MNTKTLTIINAILIVAVIILFVLQFKKPTQTEVVKKETVAETKSHTELEPIQHYTTSSEIKFAYVNSDTVTKYYEFSKVMTKKLERQQANAEAKLKKIYNKYEVKRKAFEEKAPIMSQSQMQREAQELGMMEQQIMQKEQELSSQLAEKEAKAMTDYVYKTSDLMQKIGKELGYDYIMSYRVGGPMLYANPELDITNTIVEKLNEEYKKSKETKQPSK